MLTIGNGMKKLYPIAESSIRCCRGDDVSDYKNGVMLLKHILHVFQVLTIYAKQKHFDTDAAKEI